MRLILAFCLVLSSGCFYAQNDVWDGDITSIYFPTELDGKWQFRSSNDSTNVKLYDTIHFCVSKYHPTHFLAVNGINYEFFDHELKLIDAGKFVDFKMSQNDLFIRWSKAWKRYNFDTEKLSTFQADSILVAKELTYFFSNAKMGVITEEAFIEPNYYRIAPFEEFNVESANHYLLTLNKGKFGLIDFKGRTIIPEVASMIQQEDFDVLKYKEENWKYVFPDGKVVDPMGGEIHLYSNNEYKIYTKDRSHGILYQKHVPVAKTKIYDDIFPFGSNRNYFVRRNGKVGLLNPSFNEVISPFCDQLEPLMNSNNAMTEMGPATAFYKFSQNDKWGVVNANGQVLIQPTYDNILMKFQIGKVAGYKIAKNGFVGVIDQNEKVIIPLSFNNVEQFGDGFVTQKDLRIGFMRSDGKQVLENVYSSYRREYDFSEVQTDGIVVFKKDNLYTILNKFAEQLVQKPCKDFQYRNNVLKCYFDDGVVVYYLENGKVVETSPYPGIKIADVASYEQKGFHHLKVYDKEYLEINHLTGKFGSRRMLYSGISMSPKYKYHKNTNFGTWFEACKIIDTSLIFAFRNFPELMAVNVFNHIDCSNGKHYFKPILIHDLSNTRYFYSSSDVFVLSENERMQFLTREEKDPIDYRVNEIGLTYLENVGNGFQKIYVGGEFEFVDMAHEDISMISFFHFLNPEKNLWFSDVSVAAQIMSPTHGLKFKNGILSLRDIRETNRINFSYKISDFKELENWRIYAYKNENQKTWNLTTDLRVKTPEIADITAINSWEDPTREFIILEKKINGASKMAIFSTLLTPITDFEYDEITYAGNIGFLVKANDSYFYLDQFGQKIER